MDDAMSPTRHSNVKILVIDDDTSMLAFLKLHLQKAGYVVLLAEDGIVGGRLALSASPDLILLDVQMPYLSGYELVEALKVDPATWDIPVVFLTADKHVEQRTRMLRAEAFLKKPVKVERLLEVVALFTNAA
jgi:two-component system, sensor histidine kinase and response regulator